MVSKGAGGPPSTLDDDTEAFLAKSGHDVNVPCWQCFSMLSLSILFAPQSGIDEERLAVTLMMRVRLMFFLFFGGVGHDRDDGGCE